MSLLKALDSFTLNGEAGVRKGSKIENSKLGLETPSLLPYILINKAFVTGYGNNKVAYTTKGTDNVFIIDTKTKVTDHFSAVPHSSSIIDDNGNIYINGNDQNLYKYDKDFNLDWQVTCSSGDYNRHNIIIRDNYVYTVNGSNFWLLDKYDIETGNRLISSKNLGRILASNNTFRIGRLGKFIYVPDYNTRKIIKYDLETGDQISVLDFYGTYILHVDDDETIYYIYNKYMRKQKEGSELEYNITLDTIEYEDFNFCVDPKIKKMYATNISYLSCRDLNTGLREYVKYYSGYYLYSNNYAYMKYIPYEGGIVGYFLGFPASYNTVSIGAGIINEYKIIR